MKVHRFFLWYKLSDCIRIIFANDQPPIVIQGLEESYDYLKFIISFENKVILHHHKQAYKIHIEIKPAVCELITIENFNLFKQHFENFLRIKYAKLNYLKKPHQSKCIELKWYFTLDFIPGFSE